MSRKFSIRLLCMLLAVAGVTLPAHAHDAFREYIWHRVQLDVNARHVDVTVELTFFEDWSARERERMDTNGDGRIQRSEIEAYGNQIATTMKQQLSLRIAGQRVPLILLYSPEINLLGRETVDGGHLQLTLHLFSATPRELPIGSAITVEDRLWPEARSLAEISTRNGAVQPLDAGNVVDRTFPASRDDALQFTAHYIKTASPAPRQ